MSDPELEKVELPETPSAPPPPAEVKIRTMRSDLESMARSGGGMPQFQNIAVPGLSLGNGAQGKNAVAAAAVRTAAAPKRNGLVVTLVVIAVLAAVALVGYAAYQIFFAGGGNNETTTGTAAAPVAPAPVAPTPITPASSAFIHASLFKEPADQALILVLSANGVAMSAADLQTFDQKLTALLAGAEKTASVIEVNVETVDRHGVSAHDLLAAMNAPILSDQALAHFNPDATFFIYQDKNGFWPGIVLSLNVGDNWLYAEKDVAQLESSPDVANFFLTNIGAPAGGFVDGTVSSTAVRVLQFVNVTPPAYFLYGWDNPYLILSASEDGFAAALARLQ